jgi:hypothetical protein
MYLESVINQFKYYKMLGEKTFDQLSDDQMFWQYNEESNSIAKIISHLSGNMLSRWTSFMTSDGEKEWRNRDQEFAHNDLTKEELIKRWNAGWDCLFKALAELEEADLNKEVYIRNMGHTVTEAINRQLAHYPYHIGQIVFIGKMLRNNDWTSLSIPKGKSEEYNRKKFIMPKNREHFTKEFLSEEEDN